MVSEQVALAIDLRVQKSAMNDYSLLTITGDGVTGPKPKDKWIKEDELAATCNYWALNAIYMELLGLSFKELLHALLKRSLRYPADYA